MGWPLTFGASAAPPSRCSPGSLRGRSSRIISPLSTTSRPRTRVHRFLAVYHPRQMFSCTHVSTSTQRAALLPKTCSCRISSYVVLQAAISLLLARRRVQWLQEVAPVAPHRRERSGARGGGRQTGGRAREWAAGSIQTVITGRHNFT
jgi:hypothetical protein